MYREDQTLRKQLLAKEAAVKGGNYLHEESIWKYLLEIATGMYYMHSKHVLHRDVKTVRMIASFCVCFDAMT